MVGYVLVAVSLGSCSDEVAAPSLRMPQGVCRTAEVTSGTNGATTFKIKYVGLDWCGSSVHGSDDLMSAVIAKYPELAFTADSHGWSGTSPDTSLSVGLKKTADFLAAPPLLAQSEQDRLSTSIVIATVSLG